MEYGKSSNPNELYAKLKTPGQNFLFDVGQNMCRKIKDNAQSYIAIGLWNNN